MREREGIAWALIAALLASLQINLYVGFPAYVLAAAGLEGVTLVPDRPSEIALLVACLLPVFLFVLWTAMTPQPDPSDVAALAAASESDPTIKGIVGFGTWANELLRLDDGAFLREAERCAREDFRRVHYSRMMVMIDAEHERRDLPMQQLPDYTALSAEFWRLNALVARGQIDDETVEHRARARALLDMALRREESSEHSADEGDRPQGSPTQ